MNTGGASADAKYFQRGKVHELRDELAFDKRDPKHTHRRHALKKVVANMTMGNDMSSLFPDVLACIDLPIIEIKKMVYLYLLTYAKFKPDLAATVVGTLARDAADENPLIRALALRTLSNIPVDKAAEALCEPLHQALQDKDPYVCKTAAMCVPKIFVFKETLARSEGLLDHLRALLNHDNPTVVANAVAALGDISTRDETFQFNMNVGQANKLLSALDESNEWSQAYILESVMSVVPDDPNDAELLADRISPRLQHSNSAVVLTAVRIMAYLTNYMQKESAITNTIKKLGPPLVTLLHGHAEIQYIALRNILLIMQRQRDFLQNDLKVFFCKYNDPIYVKLAKLEIMFRLTSEANIGIVLPELKEYAAEVDVDFVRKAVRSIGRCAIKVERSADKCIEALVELITTRVNYVVQEAIVVIKDIFRKYPNHYESIIGTLCENLDALDEPEAKASMIWIIGQYSDRIENADELLTQFLESFKDDTADVQLALLTAIVKLFIKRPSAGQELVPKVLKLATEEVDNPDLRDRGFIYWRLLSTDPVSAKTVILSDRPSISTEADNMDGPLLNQLLYNISTLASLTHRPPNMSNHLISRISKFRIMTYPHVQGDNSDPSASKIISTLSLSAAPTSSAAAAAAALVGKSGVTTYQDISNPYAFNDISTTQQRNNMNGNLLDLLDINNMDDPHQDGVMQQQDVARPFDVYGSVSTSMMQQQNFGGNANNPFSGMGMGAPVSGMLSGSGGATQGLLGLDTPAMPLSRTQTLPSSSAGYRPSAGLSSTPGAILDPFAKTSVNPSAAVSAPLAPTQMHGPAAQMMQPSLTGSRPTDELMSLALNSGHVAAKSLLLSAQLGRGLEIHGTFSRAHAVMKWDLTLTNRALQPLTDFAIAINKNTFSVCPATPLEIRSPLFPNQTIETSLKLKIDGLPVLSTPVNNIQVAVKTNAGIVYFQTLVPLYILFVEQGRLDPQTWLKLWRQDIPNETKFTVTVSATLTSSSLIRSTLQTNNVFTVAERFVDGHACLYLNCKLEDGTLMLVELRVDGMGSRLCGVTVKSYGVHLFEAFQDALNAILG